MEGQAGTDTLQFNGANVTETYDLSANRERLRLTRDVSNVVMDLHGVEHVRLAERAGADMTVVHDLTGTDVTKVRLDLAGSPDTGVADGATPESVFAERRFGDTQRGRQGCRRGTCCWVGLATTSCQVGRARIP